MKEDILYGAGRGEGLYMTENIKISVIIPVYNTEEYLNECLESICSQTLKEIEIICVDDGSTDNSLRILADYAARDSRIRLLKQSNQYAGVARNLGMRYASGKYLCFLDSDDFFSAFFLEKMYIAAEKYESDIVICNCYNYDSMTGQTSKGYMREEFLPEDSTNFSKEDISDKLFQITDGWPWNKLFRTEFIQRSGLSFSSTRTANDGYFVFMALALAARITKVDDYLINWRINNRNSLSNTRNKSWYCGFQMLYEMKQGLKKNNLYEMMEKTFLNFSLEYILWSLEQMEFCNEKEKLYECIQTECKDCIGITNLPAENYYHSDLYIRYKYIEEHTFSEYLMSLLEGKIQEADTYQIYNCRLRDQLQNKVWLFPFKSVSKGKSIILYGAGKMGQDYYRQIQETGYCEVVLWMDRKFENGKRELDIQGWKDKLDLSGMHQVVVALLNKTEAEKSIKMLSTWGVPENRIIWNPSYGCQEMKR
ncbi:glycosyltransferase family 2 protein [Lachnospiraceae bacterium 29-91]